MSDLMQPIFTRAYSEELRERVGAGEGLLDYLDTDMTYPDEGILQSTLLIPDKIPVLEPTVEADVDNAIKLYDFLHNLDKTQASDKRLWIYLSHVTFREYTMQRWPLKVSKEELTNNQEARRKSINYIGERWFLSGNARSLRRHSVARLWWAAYLTVSPWEKDPEYFGGLENSDRYIYTRTLFSNQDIVQQILERKLGWSDRLLVVILEYLRQNPDFAQNRITVRNLIKELNLVLGYRKLTVLNFEELLEIVAETAKTTATAA